MQFQLDTSSISISHSAAEEYLSISLACFDTVRKKKGVCVRGCGTRGKIVMRKLNLWDDINRERPPTVCVFKPPSRQAWLGLPTVILMVKGLQSAYLISKLFFKTKERRSVSILLYKTRKHVIHLKMEMHIKLNLPPGAHRTTRDCRFFCDNKKGACAPSKEPVS